MTTPTKIITHPGVAHADEFIAICLALHQYGIVPVERCNPTPADLDSQETMVVDIGHRHEPQRLNFDHHHDRDLPSSLQLVAQHLGLHTALSKQGWYDVIDYGDRKGPQKLGEVFGIAKSDVVALDNPIAVAMMSQFSRYQGTVPRAFLETMKSIGEDITKKALRYADDHEKAASLPVQEVNGTRYIVNDQKLGFALEDYARAHDVHVLVRPADTRRTNGADGWEFKQVMSSKHVDFNRVRNHPDFQLPGSFVHANGFMARNTNPDCDIAAIIKQASRQVARYDRMSGSWQEIARPKEERVERDFSR